METQASGRARAYAVLFRYSLPLLPLVSIYTASLHLTPNQTVFDGQYGFGPAIMGIVKEHRLGAIDQTYGWWCYACRMPLVPMLGALSYRLSPKMAVFLLLKNSVFWSLWIYAFLRLKRHYNIPDKWALVTISLLLLAPYDLSIAGWPDVEEGYLFTLIALSFSLLLTLEGPLSALALGVSVAAIYLTKSSMLPLCEAISVWIVIRCWRSAAMIAVPLVSLALAILGWGMYVQAVTGVFAFASNSSSWNGLNLYKGNNPYADSLYPRTSLDVLGVEEYAHKLLPFVPVHNEWELSHAQLALAERYIRENPRATLRMDLKKLAVACCDVKESPEMAAGKTRWAVLLSNIVNHLALAWVFILGAVNALRRRLSEAEGLAALLTVTYLLPYFAGFLYMRHMAPIYGVVALTAAVQLARRHSQVPSLSNAASVPASAR